MRAIPAYCTNCRHLRDSTVDDAPAGMVVTDSLRETCDAFPRGIPDPILIGSSDHTKAYPGDHGVRFDPIHFDGPRPGWRG